MKASTTCRSISWSGSGVTLEGTIGHVKSALDSMLRRGELKQVILRKGRPPS